MNKERKEIKDTQYIDIGGLEVSLVGNLDSDINHIMSCLRAQINEQLQEIKDRFPSGGVNTVVQDLYMDHMTSIYIGVTRTETDSEYEMRMKREEKAEAAKLVKENKQKAEDIKTLAELTKRLGVEIVGGMPAIPKLPEEKVVKRPKQPKPKVRSLRW